MSLNNTFKNILNSSINKFILTISHEFKIDKNLLKNIWKKTDMIFENHKPIENKATNFPIIPPNLNNSEEKELLFEKIATECREKIDSNTIKTKGGNTQNAERVLIKQVINVLESMGLYYEVAGSQQSKDFKNVGKIGLDIEVKKTDSFTIYFNDTCPSSDIYYLIFFTGKEYVKKDSIPPRMFNLNGNIFIKDSPWVSEYFRDIENIRDKWCRGENAKKLPGCMSVYARPTFKSSIKFLFNP